MEKREEINQEEARVSHWPWKDLVGFILCIALTAFSLTAVLYSSYQPTYVFMILTGLAFTQAMIQLVKLQPGQ
ncbi:hypothetical protein [Halobacillus litoralis]|uniref:hypothetical protein n=1 Tax=Halobacillus litoralis TaxID=45668 RepID=UPI00136C8875|nr:hypothetical protein [Halobacillus litoralis]MYL39122.1 hypothetical protein [Halobacillus litoralis]